MQIKRFEAKDMTSALARIKKEFGSEAVILSAKSIKKPSGILGIPKDAGVAVTAAIDPSRVSDVKNLSPGQENDPCAPTSPDLLNPGRKGRLLNSLQSGIGVFRKKGIVMKKRNDSIPDKQSADGFHGFLLKQGVEEAIAADLAKRMPGGTVGLASFDAESVAIAMTGALEQMGALAGPVRIEKTGQTVVAFVGPTGVGKTTVVAKLAAAQAIDMGRRVGVITLDCQRIGAVEQMRIFTDIIGVPLEVASDRKTFAGALHRLGSCELVLVDTRGAGINNQEAVRDLQSMFTAHRGLSVQLVLSAGTKSGDLDAAIRLFDALSVDGLLFTKLDESTAFGNVINQLVKTGIPVSYISDGQQIPEDLYPATIRRLVDLFTLPLRRPEKIPELKTGREYQKPAGRVGRRNNRLMSSRRPSESPSFEEAAFVANINSDIFHLPDCKWTKMIKPGNVIEFAGIDDAVKKGFNPCRYCRPDRPGQARTSYRPGAARKIAGYR